MEKSLFHSSNFIKLALQCVTFLASERKKDWFRMECDSVVDFVEWAFWLLKPKVIVESIFINNNHRFLRVTLEEAKIRFTDSLL